RSSISQKTSRQRSRSWRAFRLGSSRVSRVGDGISPSRTSRARFSAPDAKKIQGKRLFRRDAESPAAAATATQTPPTQFQYPEKSGRPDRAARFRKLSAPFPAGRPAKIFHHRLPPFALLE